MLIAGQPYQHQAEDWLETFTNVGPRDMATTTRLPKLKGPFRNWQREQRYTRIRTPPLPLVGPRSELILSGQQDTMQAVAEIRGSPMKRMHLNPANETCRVMTNRYMAYRIRRIQ